jgi:ribulose-bisphosphate carboxylase large chain
VQAGGGVHGHPEGTRAGAAALRAAVEAAVADEPLEVRAQESAELGAALEKWGTETPR